MRGTSTSCSLTVRPDFKITVVHDDGLGEILKSREVVPAQPVDATPSDINLFSKGGVHDASETMETVFGPAGRYVEPLEGWTVVT
jgi:hypothetical protein